MDGLGGILSDLVKNESASFIFLGGGANASCPVNEHIGSVVWRLGRHFNPYYIGLGYLIGSGTPQGTLLEFGPNNTGALTGDAVAFTPIANNGISVNISLPVTGQYDRTLWFGIMVQKK